MSVMTSQVLQQSKSDVKLMKEEKRKDRGGTVRTMEGLTLTERHKSWLQSRENIASGKNVIEKESEMNIFGARGGEYLLMDRFSAHPLHSCLFLRRHTFSQRTPRTRSHHPRQLPTP